MTEKIDPELADDREVIEEDTAPVELPEYDSSEFELPDDYEYVDVEDEDGGETDGD